MRTGSKNNSLSQEYKRKWGEGGEGGELAGSYGERNTRSDPWAFSPTSHTHYTHTHMHARTHIDTRVLPHADSARPSSRSPRDGRAPPSDYIMHTPTPAQKARVLERG